MDGLLGALGTNDLFVGGLSIMVIGAVLAAIRYLPQLLWNLTWRWFGVVVTVREQTIVKWLGVWLAEYHGKSKWLEAAAADSPEGLQTVLRPGPGLHTFTYHGRRFYLSHDLEDAGLAGKISVMTLRCLWPDRVLITDLMNEVVQRANRERWGKTPVFVSARGWWELMRLVPKRTADTVFLRPGLLDEIFNDASWFFQSEGWYRTRGIPYRRGYLLHGKPGNGKSTIVQAVAAHCSASVYLLSFSDKDFTDRELGLALGRVPAKSIVVLEDLEKIDLGKTGITLPGLLNALDGPLASEARILIATANEIGGLGEAMLRPGRVDRRWLIDTPEPMAIRACLERFGVDGVGPIIARQAVEGGWSMAELQAHLSSHFKVPLAGTLQAPLPLHFPAPTKGPSL